MNPPKLVLPTRTETMNRIAKAKHRDISAAVLRAADQIKAAEELPVQLPVNDLPMAVIMELERLAEAAGFRVVRKLEGAAGKPAFLSLE